MEKIPSAAFQDLHQKGPTAPLLFEHGNKARNRRAFRFFCPYLERASFDIASLGAAEPAFSPVLNRDAQNSASIGGKLFRLPQPAHRNISHRRTRQWSG
jgi:hypothetical protein